MPSTMMSCPCLLSTCLRRFEQGRDALQLDRRNLVVYAGLIGHRELLEMQYSVVHETGRTLARTQDTLRHHKHKKRDPIKALPWTLAAGCETSALDVMSRHSSKTRSTAMCCRS